MDHPVHYTNCPVCGNNEFLHVFKAKDHTVSGQEFQLIECSVCRLRLTQDAPGQERIAPYYRSEDYISHSNSSKGLINRLYQVVRKRTLKQKRRLVIRLSGKQSGDLLDLGSGTGAFASEMKSHGWSVRGLEPDASARQLASELNKVELEDLRSFYSLPEKSFDIITLWHVLEHVHDLNGYFTKLKLLLKPGGRLLIAVPNYTSVDAAHYGKYWAAYDVPRHLYHFSPDSMKQLAERHGLKICSRRPMWYDSFYISLLSSRYKNGRTNYFGAFMTGFFSNLNALGNAAKCSSVLYIISEGP